MDSDNSKPDPAERPEPDSAALAADPALQSDAAKATSTADWPPGERQAPEGLGGDPLSDGAGAAARLIEAVRLVRSEHDPDDVEILLRHKVRACDTLDSLGLERNVTRERIRQREARFAGKLEAHGGRHADDLASLVYAELSPLVTTDVVEQCIDEILLPVVNAHQEADSATSEIARHMIRSKLKLEPQGSVLLSERGQALKDQLAELITSEADDVGLVNVGMVADEIPDAMPFLDELLDVLGFVRVGKHPALRDTLRARIKLGLLQLGRPATKEEIAERAQHRSPPAGSGAPCRASRRSDASTRPAGVSWSGSMRPTRASRMRSSGGSRLTEAPLPRASSSRTSPPDSEWPRPVSGPI